MKKNYKSILLLVSLLFLFFFYLFHSELLVKETISYSTLFFHNIFPTSFIFILLSYLLIENNLFFYLQKIMKRKALYFYLVSLISGYPAGMIYLKEALINHEVTIKEANQYSMFSHFPNPIFVLYHCNKLFSHSIYSIIFYGIIITSQLIIYLMIPKEKSNHFRATKANNSFTASFQKVLLKTMSVLLIIYGTSIFFDLISCIFLNYFTLPNYLYVWLNGTFDLTKGIMTSSILKSKKLQGILLYYFIVFGSIPIHIQIKSILTDTSISYRSFLKGRIIAFLLCSGCWIWIINSTTTI